MASHPSSTNQEIRWDEHAPIIKKLYVEDKKTLAEVAEIMKSRYGVIARPYQYEYQLRKWKVTKYRKAEDWKSISRKIQARADQGKKSVVYYNGTLVKPETLRRETKRCTPLSMLKTHEDTAPPLTPPGCHFVTPEPEIDTSLCLHHYP
ncbi:hypothetical protein GQ53DRAFT_805926 [Thozetella sp. PMI_491]|nr:hypothetical protein GQ53DRAFT_805926 [Thozetella sp. PMI_491]